MSLHSAQPTTPASQLAAELLKTATATARQRVGRHRLTFLRKIQSLARAGEWHTMWCLLGDLVDEMVDVAIAWFAVAAGFTVVVALGATIGFVGGPVATLAYIVALIVAVLLWFRWDGGTTR